MSINRLNAAAFAGWLTDQGYAHDTTRDAQRVAARFLKDHPDLADLRPAVIEAWSSALPVGTARQVRTRTHLRRLLDYARATLPTESLPALEDQTSHQSRTLEDYQTWLRNTGAAANTIKHRRSVVRAFLTDHPTFLAVPEDVIEQWLIDQHLSQSTRSAYRGHLRSLYRWAELENLSPETSLRPRSGPGSSSSASVYGRGRCMVAVPSAWQREIESWIDWMASAGRPETTLGLREYHLRRFAADNLHRTPHEVTVDDLAGWMAAKPWAVETRRSYRSSLRSFYGWAHQSGRITTDPSRLLPTIHPPRYVARPAPEATILHALATSDDRARLMIRLGAELGMRRGEISRTHADDVLTDRQGRASLVVVGKGGHQRRLPLSPDLARLIASHAAAAGGGYVFPGQIDGHLSPRYVGDILGKALEGSYTGHTLRHRFATAAYAPMRDLFTVQTLLGHASPVTTRRYVELPPDALRDAMAAAKL